MRNHTLNLMRPKQGPSDSTYYSQVRNYPIKLVINICYHSRNCFLGFPENKFLETRLPFPLPLKFLVRKQIGIYYIEFQGNKLNKGKNINLSLFLSKHGSNGKNMSTLSIPPNALENSDSR